MSIDCRDNIVLFIANVEEGTSDIEWEPCDFGVRWLYDLIDELCLESNYQMVRGDAENKDNIIEQILVKIADSAENSVALAVKLDKYMKETRRWHTQLYVNNSMWVYNMVNGESGMRRSLLYNIYPTDRIARYGDTNNPFVIDERIAIERHFCWETPESDSHLALAFDLWGTVNNPSYIKGTEDGRICFFASGDPVSDAPSQIILHDMWIGIQEDAGCGLDEWNPLMELEDGFLAFTDSGATVQVDATASGGEYVEVDFTADPLRIPRVGIELFQAFPGANYEQWRGEYVVLLRCRVSDASTSCTVIGRGGWRTTRTKAFIGNAVQVDGALGTDWRLVDIGIAKIPPDLGRICASNPGLDELDNYSIGINASRETGAGELCLDALYLIPRTHFAAAHNENPSTEFINFAENRVVFFNHEDDTEELRYYTERTDIIPNFISPDSDFRPDMNNFTMPRNGSRIVMAAQGFDQSTGTLVHRLDYQTNFIVTTFTRWLSYRQGDEE